MKKLHAAMATEAQKYIASMLEVHTEVGQLRDNLREQHRIWLDFYSTVFHVCVLTPCVCDGLMQRVSWLYLGWRLLHCCHNTMPANTGTICSIFIVLWLTCARPASDLAHKYFLHFMHLVPAVAAAGASTVFDSASNSGCN